MSVFTTRAKWRKMCVCKCQDNTAIKCQMFYRGRSTVKARLRGFARYKRLMGDHFKKLQRVSPFVKHATADSRNSNAWHERRYTAVPRRYCFMTSDEKHLGVKLQFLIITVLQTSTAGRTWNRRFVVCCSSRQWDYKQWKRFTLLWVLQGLQPPWQL